MSFSILLLLIYQYLHIYRQHMLGSFFENPLSLCRLIGIFRSFTFKVIIDVVCLISTIFVIIFCSLPLFFGFVFWFLGCWGMVFVFFLSSTLWNLSSPPRLPWYVASDNTQFIFLVFTCKPHLLGLTPVSE